MGADYYIDTYLVVHYANGQKNYVKVGNSQRGYVSWYPGEEYDSDSEGAQERLDAAYKDAKQNQMDSHNSNKVLYADGEWVITSKDKIAFYKELIDEYNKKMSEYSTPIPDAEIIEIIKSISARE